MSDTLNVKQKQFIKAMELYENKRSYVLFGKSISVINTSFQILLMVMVLPNPIGIGWQLFSLAISYILADFINGIIHMYMDNNDNYESFAGPFIASFHLHHRTPLYKKNKLPLVYFNESGSKIWLAGFLILSVVMTGTGLLHPVISHIFLYFSIFSCVAEVSHYLCHVSSHKTPMFLARVGLLLSKRHHGRHHIEDNVNYAFLNGLTDSLINQIAKRVYPGYKNTTDKHYELYTGKGTANR